MEPCLFKALQLIVTTGNYSLMDDLYIVDLVETNVVLGVKWLSNLGHIMTNYQTLEMGFNAPDGMRVFLWGMSNEALRVF